MTPKLSFCKVTFKNHYAICEVNEGEIITIEKNKALTTYVLNHFKDSPFVFITNRINSYSVDPFIYIDNSKIKTLIGIGVVTTHFGSFQSCKAEKLFYKKHFEMFFELEAAIKWSEKIHNDYLNNSSDSIAVA